MTEKQNAPCQFTSCICCVHFVVKRPSQFLFIRRNGRTECRLGLFQGMNYEADTVAVTCLGELFEKLGTSCDRYEHSKTRCLRTSSGLWWY